MDSRRYELVYVVKPDASEQEIADLQQQVEQVAARMGGTLESTDNWGKRKLAYEIGHHRDGVYVLHVITGGGELMKELDRRLKNIDLLLRHLVVRVDVDQRIVERAQTRRLEESRRRRVARGLPPDRQPGEGPQREDSESAETEAEAGR